MAFVTSETREYSSLVLTNGSLEDDSQLPATMGAPRQIACYSVTAAGVEPGISSLRYFVTPPLGADLKFGCQSFMQRYRGVLHRPQRLDSVLLACLKSDAKEYLLQADVVVRRGVLVECVIESIYITILG